ARSAWQRLRPPTTGGTPPCSSRLEVSAPGWCRAAAALSRSTSILSRTSSASSRVAVRASRCRSALCRSPRSTVTCSIRSLASAGRNPPNVNIHVMPEAYSHELISAGFWPGNADAPRAEYYAYAMPPIDGLPAAAIRPAAAGWEADRGEFLLPYDAVRTSADPAATLLAFLESTYDAAADP